MKRHLGYQPRQPSMSVGKWMGGMKPTAMREGGYKQGTNSESFHLPLHFASPNGVLNGNDFGKHKGFSQKS